MKISFHGAAQGVTGSCHLVEAQGRRILVDCGLFQGSRELDEDNAIPFGFDARAIDFVLLTHAHLDHCGRLPLLVKRGFQGEIIATQATAELARLVMLDAANLQAEQAKPRGHHDGKAHPAPPPPLYTIIDATDCMARFGRAATYKQAIQVCPGVRATFYNAGHILGSASVLIEVEEKGGVRSALFSGDIGSATPRLLPPPEVPASADAVVMETTYGDRLHRSFDETLKEFHQVVNATLSRGGNVVIPTFALERAQEILFFLRQGMAENKLPPSFPVYLDSPMAISATQIFERHRDDFAPAVKSLFEQGIDPFALPELHFTREKAGLHRHQPGQGRGGDHGGIGHVHGRADSPSPDPQYFAARSQHPVCRLCRCRHAGQAHHRRGEGGRHSRRALAGQGGNSHHQRFFRPRRPE